MSLPCTRIAIHNDVLVIAYKVKRFELRQSDCHIFWQFGPVKVFKIFELREVSLVYHSPSTRLVTIFRLLVQEFCQEAVVRPLLGYSILQEYIQTAFDAPELEHPTVVIYGL